MAFQNTSSLGRSISLPTTLHPIDVNIEDHLRRLSASQAGPASSSSLCQNLLDIKNLYEQMNEVIHLPHNQSSLSQMNESILDGSIFLLDASSFAIDILSKMKESILDLQSAFRRGSYDEGIHIYLISRNKISKMITKCLANLKKSEKSDSNFGMLKEAEEIALSTLRAVLSYVLGKKATSQTHGWSIVKNLVKSKNVSSATENETELEAIDRFLSSSKKQSGAEPKALLKDLETLEVLINELEDGVESVSRCFVKTRVSLLNLLSH